MDEWSGWIENRMTAERFRFWRGEIADGAFRNQMRVPGGNPGVPSHIHPFADEWFHVDEGRLGYRVGREKGTLAAGEERVLPAGVPHTWWNAGDAELVVTAEWRPGDRGEEFLRRVCAVMNRLVVEGRKPGALLMSVFFDEFYDIVRLPGPLGWRPLLRSLAGLGRWRGHGWVLTEPAA